MIDFQIVRFPLNEITGIDFRIKSNQNPRDTKSRDSKRPASLARKKDENIEKRNWEERLYEIWNKHHIPSFHREVFLKCENPINLKQTIDIIKKEIDDLEGNKSAIQVYIHFNQIYSF